MLSLLHNTSLITVVSTIIYLVSFIICTLKLIESKRMAWTKSRLTRFEKTFLYKLTTLFLIIITNKVLVSNIISMDKLNDVEIQKALNSGLIVVVSIYAICFILHNLVGIIVNCGSTAESIKMLRRSK